MIVSRVGSKGVVRGRAVGDAERAQRMAVAVEHRHPGIEAQEGLGLHGLIMDEAGIRPRVGHDQRLTGRVDRGRADRGVAARLAGVQPVLGKQDLRALVDDGDGCERGAVMGGGQVDDPLQLGMAVQGQSAALVDGPLSLPLLVESAHPCAHMLHWTPPPIAPNIRDSDVGTPCAYPPGFRQYCEPLAQ